MTVTGEPDRSLPPAAPAAATSGGHGAVSVREVCPYLAGDAGWRSAYASRDHRCGAVRPPAPLAVAKQRDLCLLAAHRGCATYLAAEGVRADAVPVSPGDDGAALWPSTVAGPLVLDPARRISSLPGTASRGGGQALLVGLMAVAFVVLAIARLQAPTASASATPPPSVAVVSGASPSAWPVGSATPSPAGSPSASPAPSPSPSPSPALTPSPSNTPSAVPTATPRVTPGPTLTATRSYRVRAGDTLGGIAKRFGTTTRILQELNGIADPRYIRIGQVLRIP